MMPSWDKYAPNRSRLVEPTLGEDCWPGDVCMGLVSGVASGRCYLGTMAWLRFNGETWDVAT